MNTEKYKTGIRKMQTAAGGPIHYSRTMTSDNLSRAANYVGEYVLRGLGALGKIFTTPLTGGPIGTNTVPLYPRTVLLANAERKLRETQEELIGKAMTWISPLNYGVALATGNGLDARKGEEEITSWSPALLAAARLVELGVGPKAVKGVKSAPRVVVNTAAKAGVKPAKSAVVAREINLGIKLNTKNGRIEVTGNYFNSSDKWYRVSERPEKIGIELNGKNVTTYDDPGINGTINGWRESMLSLNGRIIPGKGVNEGYFIFLPKKISLSKHGAAHGNTSQAAKGLIWDGTFAFSDKFPIGVIEGLAPVKIFRGMNNLGKDSRTNFVLLNWEDVPLGSRVGFHTGEMPMSNLGWFQRTNRGTYTYEPIIPEKRINVTEDLDWTKNLPGKRDYSMSRKLPYSEYTPTKLNPSHYKFVRDVVQGYGWGINRNIKPAGNKDFTLQLKGKERLGYGAERDVYEDTTNPLQVLKVPGDRDGLVTPHSTLKGAIREGQFIIRPFNRLPFNLPLNIEGTIKISEGKYLPVFSLRKVYIPKMDLKRIIDFDKSVNGMYSLEKPDINNILLENDIQRATDFKLPNIGLLPDGTVMGIDLWKNGGKMNTLDFLKNGGDIHIKKKNRGKFTSYCGGNVTSSCIARAKASGNPTLVKRATFAANARKWKHKDGGVLKGQWEAPIDRIVDSALVKKFQYGGPSPFLTKLGNRTAEKISLKRREEAEAKRKEFERDTELYKLGKLPHTYYAHKYFPHSEIIDGKHTGTGAMSGADPIGSFVVGNVVANPLFKLMGKAALFTLGKMGNSWARNKLISRELNRDINLREIIYADPDPVLPPKYALYAEKAKLSMENNILTMALEAKNYATSAERKALDARLNLEAHDLGYLGKEEQLLFYSPHNRPPTFKIFNDAIPGEKSGVNGVYDGYINQVRLTRASAQGFTPFHETLHYFGIGQNPGIAQTKVGRRWYNARPNGKQGIPLESVDAVYATEGPIQRSGYFRFDKIELALDPERLKTLTTDDLTYIKSEELPVHGITTGKQLGIKPFLEYPGDEVMPGIIEKANKKNNWMSYVKLNTPLDFKTYWLLLTGSYLSTLPFTYNK